MPFKRRFVPKKTFARKGGFKRKFVRRNGGGTNTGVQKGTVTKRPSVLHFPSSFFTKQPLPDKFYTYLHADITGYFPSGAAANGQAAFIMNHLFFPFNVNGDSAAFLNPSVTISSFNPTGLSNLIYNPVTSTGIWSQGRVWSLKVDLTLFPQINGDNCEFGVAPIAGTADAYTSMPVLASGPNSVVKVTGSGTSGAANTISGTWSIPALAGISNQIFNADPDYAFMASAAPAAKWFLQFRYATLDQAVLSNNMPYKIHCTWHVEFFSRTDTQLLIT